MPNTNFQTFHQMGQAINEVVRQATGRDAVQNIDMEHVTVAQNQYYEEVTLSAGRVSFTDRVGNTPLEKCVVQIEPVQDLHGYSKPWLGGAGKNLLDPSLIKNQSTWNVIALTLAPNTIYTCSCDIDYESGLYVYFRALSTPGGSDTNHVYSGHPITLTSTADGNLWLSQRIAQGTETFESHKIQIEAGSTVTTYEPYSNICPITGWTGEDIHVSPTTNAQDGTTYSVSFQSEAGTVYGGTLDVTTGLLTVNVFEHELTETDTITGAGSGEALFFRFTGTSDGAFFPACEFRSIDGIIANPLAICSHFQKASIISTTTSVGWIVYHSGGYNYPFVQFRFPQSLGIDTMAALREYIIAQRNAGTPITICYPLATPISYQLTPQQITTLLGTNYIWADTGDIEVKYKVLKEMY